MSTFREALTAHINGTYGYRRMGEYRPEQITDVDVWWSAGEDGTDDYGDPRLRLPELEITVTMDTGEREKTDPGWALETLMKLALGIDL